MKFNEFPAELVHRIFLAGMDELEHEASTSSFYVYPTLLSSTCKYWKAATLSCPELWSTVCVELGTKSRPPRPVIEEYLKKSKGRPFSFSVHLSPIERHLPFVQAAYSEQFQTLLHEVFLPHHLLWKDVDLHIVASNIPANLFTTLPEGGFPLLARLKVKDFNAFNDEGYYVDTLPISKIIKQSPRLSCLDLDIGDTRTRRNNFPYQILGNTHAPARWKPLTSLSVQVVHWTPAMTLTILSPMVCPNLQVLSVVYHRDTEQLPFQVTNGQFFHCTHLHTLRIATFGKDRHTDLCAMTLNHLDAPRLCTLEIRYEAPVDRDCLLKIPDMIAGVTTRYGACPLQRFLLRLPESTKGTDLLLQCIQGLPASVWDLNLTFSGSGQDLWDVTDGLTVRRHKGAEILLPRLRDIRLDIHSFWDWTDEVRLLEMLKSRLDAKKWSPVVGLANVRIKIGESRQEGLRYKLKGLLTEIITPLCVTLCGEELHPFQAMPIRPTR